MRNCCEAHLVKRISFFVQDRRELREKRGWLEASFFGVALGVPFPRRSCERRDTRYERRWPDYGYLLKSL
jgi:hypothetical protein